MQVSVGRAGRSWSVTVTPEEGAPVEYRYRSQAQARFFAAVFELGPQELPKAHRARGRKPVNAIRQSVESEIDHALDAAFAF
jgi:hypothetical protein